MKIIKYINKILPLVKKKSDLTKFKNILVVSNTGLGDTVLGTPAMKTLRKSFPEINITFLVNRKMFPLFSDYDFIDDYLLYETGFFNQIKLVKKLRKKEIDTIFLFHSNGPEDIFFSILSGANNILKMTDKSSHKYEDIFLNKMSNEKKHIIERKIDLVRVFNPNIIDTTMSLPSKFDNKKNDIFANKKYKYIGLQLGAQDTYKIWPVSKFIELSNRVLKDNNIKIVLFGASKLEKMMAKELVSSVSQKKFIINMCGKSKIEELPELVNGLDLLITNDTGLMHISIALHIPTISLFGPTDSTIFGPYQNLSIHTVIQKDGSFVNNVPKKKRTQEGIDLISVEEVYKEYLQKRKLDED